MITTLSVEGQLRKHSQCFYSHTLHHCDVGGGVAGCDIFLQCDGERLRCAVYCTLEHLWEVEVGDIL